jgi:ABC-type sugar transport system substrate-binding protein
MDATYFNKITDTNLQINGVNNFTAAQYDILVYNPTDISDMTISYTLGEDK